MGLGFFWAAGSKVFGFVPRALWKVPGKRHLGGVNFKLQDVFVHPSANPPCLLRLSFGFRVAWVDLLAARYHDDQGGEESSRPQADEAGGPVCKPSPLTPLGPKLSTLRPENRKILIPLTPKSPKTP